MGQIDHVIWNNDPSVPEGETFKFRSASAPGRGLPLVASEGKHILLAAKYGDDIDRRSFEACPDRLAPARYTCTHRPCHHLWLEGGKTSPERDCSS